MSVKEISAIAMLLGSIVISAWVFNEAMTAGVQAEMSGSAWKMLWAIGYVIVFNIIAVIIGTIIASIAQREELKDERADERDKLINGKAMGVAYFLLSVGVLGVLIWQAAGLAPNLVPYALFGVSMFAGAGYAAAQIALYRMS
jgi:hypothetical protein